MIEKLSTDDTFALLARGSLARLGCIADGRPYVVPVNYCWDGDSPFIHSQPGRKIDALRAHSAVCLQVDEMSGRVAWRSALVFGEYEEVVEPVERTRLLAAFQDRFPLLTPVEASSGVHPQESIVFRIRVTNITGVREG